jgi:hypothetical protein
MLVGKVIKPSYSLCFRQFVLWVNADFAGLFRFLLASIKLESAQIIFTTNNMEGVPRKKLTFIHLVKKFLLLYKNFPSLDPYLSRFNQTLHPSTKLIVS